jgi:hypothetical protein
VFALRVFLTIIIYAAGVFAVALGALHFTFPERFGFRDSLFR